jgi:soluble lytic murein transglycosylase-like protein
MQLMPVTAKSLGVEDSFDPEANINGGTMYFKRLLDRFGGNVEFALAAYNAGSRYVRKYNGVPPFRQTKTYIHKVFKYHRQYKQEVEA